MIDRRREAEGAVGLDEDMSLVAAMPHADGGPFLNRAFVERLADACPASSRANPGHLRSIRDHSAGGTMRSSFRP
jgi:hypothetical protein